MPISNMQGHLSKYSSYISSIFLSSPFSKTAAHYITISATLSRMPSAQHRFQFGGMLSTLSPSCLRNGNDFRPLTGQLTNSQQSGATPRTMCKGLGNGMESGRRPPETLRHKVKPTHPHGPDRLNWEIAETDDMRRDPDDRSPS